MISARMTSELPEAQVFEPAGETRRAPAGGVAQSVLFRFACAYFLLYNFPFPIDLIPPAAKPVEALWNAVVPWAGRLLFGLDITVRPNGSGDTTYNYVQVLCFLVLAAAATLVWSLLDRRRGDYARAWGWLRIYLRFVVGVAMLSYGAAKVIPAQFPAPALGTLLEPFGNASPMGILWTFMGASAAYTIFGGASEMLGGLLILFRRTSLLGALICAGVLVNVVMLNFSYDVPVKLYSSHLLIQALLVAAPDLRRLANLFILNRPAPAVEVLPLFSSPGRNRAVAALQILFILGFSGYMVYRSWAGYQKWSANLEARTPLYGIWNVEEFAADGKVLPPLLTDGVRWRQVLFEYPEMLTVLPMDLDAKSLYYKLALDEKAGRMTLSQYKDKKWKSVLAYRQSGADLLTLEGTFDGKAVRAKLRRKDHKKFLLTSRGFHWINEYPFNR
jgi:hypothetical protein